MDAIPRFNYAGTPLEIKYQWMQTGPGGQAAIGMGDALAQFAADLGQTDTNIGQHLNRLGGVWQGRAAQAATGAVTRAAASVTARAQPGSTGHQSSQRYGDSFITTKNAIPKPPPVTADYGMGSALADGAGWVLNRGFGSNFGVQSDFSEQLAAYRAADQAANHALTTHEAATRAAVTAYDTAITGQAAADVRAHAGPGPGTPGPGGADGATGAGHRAGSGSGAGAGGAGAMRGGGGSGAGGVGAGGAGSGSAGAGSAGSGGAGSGKAASDGPGSGGAGSGGAGSGGVGSGGRAGSGGSPTAPPNTAPPNTAPAEWTPLAPRDGGVGIGRTAPGDGGVGAGRTVPGPSGGLVPTGPDYPPLAPSTPSMPALPPLGGGLPGAGPHATGHGGTVGGHPLAERGGPGQTSGGSRGGGAGSGSFGGSGPFGGGATGERAGGPGGMPLGMGGAGARGQDRDHRNNVFIPDDEPFRVEFDDVTDSVLGTDAGGQGHRADGRDAR